jgi:hypothetical protein
MHTDITPKTVNEAIKILAYNEYFWYTDQNHQIKRHVKPHHKDLDTVKSLAEAQYAWTEKQGKLAMVILKRYLSKFEKYGIYIRKLVDNPQYEAPFRVINFDKIIEKFIDEDGAEKIEMRFPYHKKIIQLIRVLKDQKCLPAGYSSYDGENKKWTFLQTDVTTYYLTLIAIRYDFKFVDTSLLDDFDKVRQEIKGYKKPTAKLVDNKIDILNAPDSLLDYWKNNVEYEKTLIQVDRLKEFGISTKGIKVKSWSELGGKIAHHETTKAWIDRNEFNRDQVLAAFQELDMWPIIMPVSGDPWAMEDIDEWRNWLQCFERNQIEYKNLAFGFEFKAPEKEQWNPVIDESETLPKEVLNTKWQVRNELAQLSKQFKYIDKETKFIFVRNRIPKTMIKSGLLPKCCFVALGGGYYTAGTDSLKRFLDNLPKTLYYNNHQPSSFDWNDKIISKI